MKYTQVAETRAVSMVNHARRLRDFGRYSLMPTRRKKPEPISTSVRSVRESWKVIRSWISKNIPDFKARFDNGANAKSIKDLAAQLGRTLPADFAESLRCHTSGAAIIPCPHRTYPSMAYSLMNPAEIVSHWQMMIELIDIGEFANDHQRVRCSKGVVQQWLAPYWIPFATDGGGDLICIDLCPTFPGKLGQIIWVPHDSSDRAILADSMEMFLSQLADNYVAGKYHDNRSGIGYGISRTELTTFPRSPLKK